MTKGKLKGGLCDKKPVLGDRLCPFHLNLLEKTPKNPYDQFECAVDPKTLRAEDGFVFDRALIPEKTLQSLSRLH